MFSSERLMVILFSSCLLYLSCVFGDLRKNVSSGYDITEFVSQLNLQFCTFVEVGQGYCSMFIEFRKDPADSSLKPDNVAEVYLGTCECATMRDWELCSIPLRKSRPYECYLDDLEPSRRNGSARVHRRLCNPTKIYESNQQCDCTASFAQRTLYPVSGFLTCYRTPLPKSICSTHSVCGVYNCDARNFFGLSMVHCDPLCLGKQPFCEELGPVTSRPPIVTSYWSDWTCPHKDDVIDVSEATCIDKENNSPAFDCLGPGSLCCPAHVKDCHCEVTTTMAEMKLTRFVFKDILFGKRFVRSLFGKSFQFFIKKFGRFEHPRKASNKYIINYNEYDVQNHSLYDRFNSKMFGITTPAVQQNNNLIRQFNIMNEMVTSPLSFQSQRTLYESFNTKNIEIPTSPVSFQPKQNLNESLNSKNIEISSIPESFQPKQNLNESSYSKNIEISTLPESFQPKQNLNESFNSKNIEVPNIPESFQPKQNLNEGFISKKNEIPTTPVLFIEQNHTLFDFFKMKNEISTTPLSFYHPGSIYEAVNTKKIQTSTSPEFLVNVTVNSKSSSKPISYVVIKFKSRIQNEDHFNGEMNTSY